MKSPTEQTNGGPFYADRVLWGIAALAAMLLFWSLDRRYLWQDEAETALLGENILKFGVPIASDGTNVVSQEGSREFVQDSRWPYFLWRWSPWIQFYIAAGSIKLLGPTTLAARLPFTLLAWLTVPLTYCLAQGLFGSRAVARLSALFLTLSVPFLLHSRQARWCGPAYLLLTVFFLALTRLARGGRGAWAVCLASIVLLFYTNYFVAIGVLAALFLSIALYKTEPLFLKRLLTVFLGTAIFVIPGALFFQVLDKRGPFQWEQTLSQLRTCAGMYSTFLVPLPIIVLLGYLLVVRRTSDCPEADWKRVTLFLLVFSLSYMVYLSFAPWLIFRYLSLLLPLAAILLALTTHLVIVHSRFLGLALLLLLLCTDVLFQYPLGLLETRGTHAADHYPSVGPVDSPLAGFLYELTHQFDTPEYVLSNYLNEHAQPTDVVLTTYDDLPMQFYTRLRVTGGLEGRQLPSDPDWIIRRHRILSSQPGKDYDVVRFIDERIDLKRYETVPLPQRDYMHAHDPDPDHHLFKTPRTGPPFLLLRRRKD